MDLKSGYPYWAVKNGLMQAFPRLVSHQSCEIAIVGGGITGALVARELAENGHDVVVVEQRDIAWGSTAASTALLQYEIDTSMRDLTKRYGERNAALAYRSCADAISLLQRLAATVRGVGFAPMRSLYYASRKAHVAALRDELALRKKHGFVANWLDATQLWKTYGLRAPGAILTQVAARVDPYRLTYRILGGLSRKGTRVFDRSQVMQISCGSRRFTLSTQEGTLSAKHVVIAAGYSSQAWLSVKVARNRSSYAFITDPLPDAALGSFKKTMVWESARPYLYMRSTSDGRLLVGGEDDAIDVPTKRDAKVDAKAQTLVEKVGRAIPELILEPAFAWAGTFAETADGLPFFGTHPQWGPRVYFAMAYGGNGITYSALGAGIIRAAVERRRHKLARLFSFRRLDA
ncbi:MAG: FAD-dependent oxidoreductase [Rhodanobacteraceae bacterium]